MRATFRRLTLLVLALGAGYFALAETEPELSKRQKEQVINAIGKRLDRSAYSYGTDFSRWPEVVEKNREAIDEADTHAEFELALTAALDEFDLSHLSLFSPRVSSMQRTGKRSGIGIGLQPIEAGKLITYVLQDSPGWRCGLRGGDLLIAVDGEALNEIEQLVGEIGDRRMLTWLRDGEELSCEVEYASFPFAERSSMEWIREDVALIRIQSFQYRFYNAWRINRFFREARNAKGIVIDLRNNRGGLSFYSRHLASKVSPRRETFSLKINRRAGIKLDQEEAAPSELAASARAVRPLPFSRPFRGELVVLVDSLSASAADIFPAFVQESGRGVVIGEQTSGALQLARPFRLPHGYRLYTPTAEILTPNGNRLEKNGVFPEVELSSEELVDDERVFELALEQIDQRSRSE